ncbi:HupE/UreJ family protein [Bradyrhizobium liaoningense]|uniref:HupE/UreJ family protein n=1 Tax=Bradyrhizobium liaoningense TaxID=43992 RepID=UPI00289F40F9|nr:HupE/UreJ family protein [Bradyrhizobium liaoningense]
MQLLAVVLMQLAASGHEARPAYLALSETAPGQFSVLWRTPVLAGMRLPVVLRLPDRVKDRKDPVVSELSDSLVERRWVDAGPNRLAGERIVFSGLQLTITDVLVRVQMLDGTVSTALVRPGRPWFEVAAAPGVLAIAGAYVLHGIEHILFGFDHLLFVLALILIVRNGRMLLWTITAFTIAHSITLSLATLGLVHVPAPPVEAMIALSIMLLACEIAGAFSSEVDTGSRQENASRQESRAPFRYHRNGKGSSSKSGQLGLTSKWPWIVAFSFGLLHGLGFASALTDIGLPHGDIPLALLSFNVGVEIGQLIFIGGVLGTMFCIRRFDVPTRIRRAAVPVASYAIGITSAFWFIERLTRFGS